jgi:pSer/pThr/pTyr-binding forkhead associated (FHA) protein
LIYGSGGSASALLWHHRCVTSSSLDRLARTAYEAYRGAHSSSLPPWEDITEQEQQAWIATVSAVTEQTRRSTLADTAPRPLVIQTGDQHQIFRTDFTVGRQGTLTIDDDFASSHHARFQAAHGGWFVEDLGSTNGTWLNEHRFQTAQRLKKGDKIRIGRTVMIVVSA